MSLYSHRIRDVLVRRFLHDGHLDPLAIEAYMRIGLSGAEWDALTVSGQAHWEYAVGVAVECVRRARPENVSLVVAMLPSQELTLADLVARGETLKEIERRALTEALRVTGGVQSRAAKILKLSPRAMSYKVRQYRLQPHGGRTRA